MMTIQMNSIGQELIGQDKKFFKCQTYKNDNFFLDFQYKYFSAKIYNFFLNCIISIWLLRSNNPFILA